MAVGAPPQFSFGQIPFPSDPMLPEAVRPPVNHTFSSYLLPEVSRKRVRDDEFVIPSGELYQSEIDRIVFNHTKKLRMELQERQRRETRLLVAAIGEGVRKLVREKDGQIQMLGKLNFALQERVKTLYMENQLWRDLALTNEATANSLRNDLEQVLAHVATEEHVSDGTVTAAAAEEDAGSCCDSSNSGPVPAATAEVVVGQGGGVRMCRRCGVKESSVLLLPCRHLCLCTMCGSTLVSRCPVCSSSMNATVHINMSS
ncbi:unnamed protein product [Cuscuta campestris]|uniref:RING-type domain-containing protein n=1 Tax=Cuscuta campestris TaxID=132261 RepID=A0A484K7Y3_9ASTE|nr:unnamed protein product [Cuscuta campestris]